MEFKFDIRKSLRPDSAGLVHILSQNSFKSPQINEIIDSIGRESSRAQGLRSIITSSTRFFASSDNKIYIKVEGAKVVGFIKTGIRKLFYSNEIGKIMEMSPLCLLDFYVHESCQRSGYGKELFEFMLKCENSTANKIAIDRPSVKSLTFMRKHYGLSDYIPQNNNFVVYRQYFDSGFAGEQRRKKVADEAKTTLISSAQQALGLGNHSQSSANASFPGLVESVEQGYGASDSYRRVTGNHPARSPNDRSQTQDRSRDLEYSNYPGRTQYPRDYRQLEESKRVYAPAAPWATTSYSQAPSTTSSQYGIHTLKHK